MCRSHLQRYIILWSSRKLVEINFYYLIIIPTFQSLLMEKNQLEVLARIVLPSEILDHFEITSVQQSPTEIPNMPLGRNKDKTDL